MIFQEWSEKFHELGYNVLPCRGKDPVAVLFRHWLYNVQPSEVVQGWADLYPDSNIGIMCGNGLVVIDVDTIDKEQTLKARAICTRLLPPSPMEKTGKKGFSLFYRAEAIRTFKPQTLAIDILGIGSYTVVPPSNHPETGRPYRWSDDVQLTHIKELPEISQEHIDALLGAFESHALFKPKTASTHSVTHDGGCAKGNRNNYFSSLAWDLITHRELANTPLTDDQIVQQLLNEDSLHLGADSYFGDSIEWKGRTDRVQNAKTFFNRTLKSAQDKEAIYPCYYKPLSEQPKGERVIVEPPQIPETVAELGIFQHHQFIASQRERLMHLIPRDGLIEMMMAYTLEMSNSRSPVLPFTGALGMCSVLASNTYSVKDNWSNLYMMAVAFSGRGKSFPQKAIIRVLNKVGGGAEALIGSRTYGSSQAILSDIPIRPKRSRIDLYDEFSSLLKGMKDSKHLGAAKEILMNAWSEGSSETGSRALFGKSVLTIKNPCITLLGYTTPDEFKDNVDKNFISSGFGARFLYFYDDLLPSDRTEIHDDDRVVHIAPSIVGRVREIFAIKPVEEDVGGTVINVGTVSDNDEYMKACLHAARVQLVPYRLFLSRDATAYYNKITARQDNAIHSFQEGKPKGFMDYRVPIMTRKGEQICRLALSYAISQNKREAVDVEHLEWSERVWDYQFDNIQYHLEGTFSNNMISPARIEQAIKGWLLERKGQTFRRTELRDKARSMYPNMSGQQFNREIDALCQTFADDGLITVKQGVGTNRSVMVSVTN